MAVPLSSFNSNIYLIIDTHIFDIHFIPHSIGSVFKWMDSLAEILAMTTQKYCSISIVSTWISDSFFGTSVRDQCRLYLQTTLSEHWNFAYRITVLPTLDRTYLRFIGVFSYIILVQLIFLITQKHFYPVAIGCVMFLWPQLLMSHWRHYYNHASSSHPKTYTKSHLCTILVITHQLLWQNGFACCSGNIPSL